MSTAGWSDGWDSAMEKANALLDKEIEETEARLRENKEDFSDTHPAVILVEIHVRSLKKLKRNLNQ